MSGIANLPSADGDVQPCWPGLVREDLAAAALLHRRNRCGDGDPGGFP
jgi:hypothetical protein